ncbi:MAG TPA: transcriptional regulator [Candidatus Methylomirabilis sp.]|nr:transcriptional regulator [Candidatus Methylomirabilis sp.]
MPRNDQVTCQWHLLRHLEASHGATLQELAAALPPELSKHQRTIRRDLEALEAAGFPLLTERIEGRVVWKLLEGFKRVPALAFSATELMALTFSRGLLKPLEGTQLHAALDSALGKAASALPAPGHAYLQQLDGVLAVGFGPHVSYRTHRETIDKLTEAINRKRSVQMRYFSASRNAMTRREVDPYRLWYANGALYLVGHCHLRGEVRLFAVERIRSCTPTDHAYQLPLHFDLEAYVQDALRVMRGGRPVTVELLFNKATATWVKDRTWHPSQEYVPEKDGRLRMTLKVAATPELVGWILSFGGGVRVIGPPELRKAVQATAERICARP